MRYLCLILFVLTITTAQAQQILPRPDHYVAVTDRANMLNSEESALLTRKLTNYQDSTSTQIAIVIISSLRGAAVEDYAQKLAQNWGIGQQGKDNGLLILISQNDRKIRIHTGYGLEAMLSDQFCKDLIDNILQPNFRATRYYKGLDDCTNLIIKQLAGQFSIDDKAMLAGSRLTKKGSASIVFWVQWVSTLIFIAFLVFVAYLYHKEKKHRNKLYILSGISALTLFIVHFYLGLQTAQKEMYLSIYNIYHDLLLYKSFTAAILVYIILITHSIRTKSKWYIQLIMFIMAPVVGVMPASILFVLLMLISIFIPVMEGLAVPLLYFIPVFGIPCGLWLMRNSDGSGGSGGYSYSSGGSSYSGGYSGGSSFGGGSFGGGGASGGW